MSGPSSHNVGSQRSSAAPQQNWRGGVIEQSPQLSPPSLQWAEMAGTHRRVHRDIADRNTSTHHHESGSDVTLDGLSQSPVQATSQPAVEEPPGTSPSSESSSRRWASVERDAFALLPFFPNPVGPSDPLVYAFETPSPMLPRKPDRESTGNGQEDGEGSVEQGKDAHATEDETSPGSEDDVEEISSDRSVDIAMTQAAPSDTLLHLLDEKVSEMLQTCQSLEQVSKRAVEIVHATEFGLHTKHIAALHEESQELAQKGERLCQVATDLHDDVEDIVLNWQGRRLGLLKQPLSVIKDARQQAQELAAGMATSFQRTWVALHVMRQWTPDDDASSTSSIQDSVAEDEEQADKVTTGEPVTERDVVTKHTALSLIRVREDSGPSSERQLEERQQEGGKEEGERVTSPMTAVRTEPALPNVSPVFAVTPNDGSTPRPMKVHIPLTLEGRDMLVEQLRSKGGISSNRIAECDVVVLDEKHPKTSLRVVLAASSLRPAKPIVTRSWLEESLSSGAPSNVLDERFKPRMPSPETRSPARLQIVNPPPYVRRQPPGKGGEARIPYTVVDKSNIVQHLAVTQARWQGVLCSRQLEKRFGRHTALSYQSHICYHLHRHINYTQRVDTFRRQLTEQGLQACRAQLAADLASFVE